MTIINLANALINLPLTFCLGNRNQKYPLLTEFISGSTSASLRISSAATPRRKIDLIMFQKLTIITITMFFVISQTSVAGYMIIPKLEVGQYPWKRDSMLAVSNKGHRRRNYHSARLPSFFMTPGDKQQVITAGKQMNTKFGPSRYIVYVG